MDDRLTRLSKTLAYVLRHRPDSIGIELDSAGWADVEDLLVALKAAGHVIDEGDLEDIRLVSDKRRYEIRDGRIRAAQGHSIPVDLGLAGSVPPEDLFHGTVERFLPSIRRQGLVSGDRSHVHLSADRSPAEVVVRGTGNQSSSPSQLSRCTTMVMSSTLPPTTYGWWSTFPPAISCRRTAGYRGHGFEIVFR